MMIATTYILSPVKARNIITPTLPPALVVEWRTAKKRASYTGFQKQAEETPYLPLGQPASEPHTAIQWLAKRLNGRKRK